MDWAAIAALASAAVALVVGLGTLWVTSHAEATKAKAQRNEYRLDEFDTLLSAYRTRIGDLEADVADRDEWKRRAQAAERRVDEYLRRDA